MTPYYSDDLVTIYHGDCREVLPTLASESVDLIATDPPFGIGKAAWDFDVMPLLEVAARECSRVLTRDGVCFWFCSIALLPETLAATSALPYRWMFIWNAPNRMQAGPLGFMKWSPALVMGHESVHRNMADLYVVQNPSRGPRAADHPTEKPVRLFTHLVSRSSDVGDLVLDPFAGSGTTLVAAKDLGRKAIGIEIEERYCEIAATRCSQEVLGLSA